MSLLLQLLSKPPITKSDLLNGSRQANTGGAARFQNLLAGVRAKTRSLETFTPSASDAPSKKGAPDLKPAASTRPQRVNERQDVDRRTAKQLSERAEEPEDVEPQATELQDLENAPIKNSHFPGRVREQPPKLEDYILWCQNAPKPDMTEISETVAQQATAEELATAQIAAEIDLADVSNTPFAQVLDEAVEAQGAAVTDDSIIGETVSSLPPTLELEDQQPVVQNPPTIETESTDFAAAVEQWTTSASDEVAATSLSTSTSASMQAAAGTGTDENLDLPETGAQPQVIARELPSTAQPAKPAEAGDIKPRFTAGSAPAVDALGMSTGSDSPSSNNAGSQSFDSSNRQPLPQPGIAAPDLEAAAETLKLTPDVHAQATSATPKAIGVADLTLKPVAQDPNASSKVAEPRLTTQQFAEANSPQIVQSIRTRLLPNGGTMTLRLDPPNLGQLQIQVTMRDGVMTASFQTANPEAARMLSHSMNQLKTTLESSGVNVEKLQVQQTPRESRTGDSHADQDSRQQNPSEDPSSRSDQQRREVLERLWRRALLGEDEIDLVA